MIKNFIPDHFEAPKGFETDEFYFRVLDDDIAELDFEAVMSSQIRLKGIFGPGSEWPKKNMTFEENVASLKIHKQEFKANVAFAYSIFNIARDKCLGCVYIDKSQSVNYDCEV
jgi:hypothetical protein